MKTKIFLVFSNIILLSLLLVSWNGKENLKKTNEILKECDITGLNFISEDDAKLLANNYKNSINTINSDFISHNSLKVWKNDSRCAWYSFDELSKYLCFIKKIHDEKYKNSPYAKLGIRIYYGRYPNDLSQSSSRQLRTQNDNYKYKHCLFFVPTNDSLYINKRNDKKEIVHKDFFFKMNETQNKGMLYINTILSLNSDKNHGSLEPPSDTSISGAYFLGE